MTVHQSSPSNDHVASSDLVAPDTTGLNFFRADASLSDLLQLQIGRAHV